MARKSTFNNKWRDKIIDLVLQGHSIAAIGRMKNFPTTRCIFSWIAANPDFKEQIEVAREIAANELYDDAINIADDCEADTAKVSKAALQVKARLAKANRGQTRKPSATVNVTNNNTAAAQANSEAQAMNITLPWHKKSYADWSEQDLKEYNLNRIAMLYDDDVMDEAELIEELKYKMIVQNGQLVKVKK
ncbi:TPA: hypothetical protein R8G43_004708 [Citrobacter freundii]|uniref:terminase small subunit-like protein n=1 Tax=Citrobacter freundii TaxID=546 RepID=UPI0015E9C2DD|nr:hypothetical protein [Citrobacter freundii]MDE8795722.1 hypothetical protein [Citrobacter freundii]QLU14069.1 hypothetical protein HV147_09175 [Citrobacter freundii]HCB1820667.1 hypothetical protein [Citrobacter freundii]HEE9834685.1 hypothetical protein [Citrobacter freundii]HEE9896498.1 hypothetical protein [Citrobacter freundii]